MHSRIFQLSTQPISKADYISDSNYYDHWFTHQIADYVNDETNREHDIEWLSDCYKTKGVEFGKDESGEYLVVTSKGEYFKSKFDKFKEAINKVTACGLDEFINGLSDLWYVNDAYEDKYGFYVDYSSDADCYGSELMTFDSFVRMCNAGTKCYIGASIDYHF